MTQTHTPGPWAYRDDGNGNNPRIVAVGTPDYDGTPDCVVIDLKCAMRTSGPDAFGESLANARRIVTAVNAHDDLVAALRDMVGLAAEAIEARRADSDEDQDMVALYEADLKLACAALRKARGEG